MRLTRLLLSNYFKRYIEREMCGENLRRTWRPVSGYKEMTKKKWYYSEFRPWTDDSKQENLPGKWHPKVRLEPIEEWTIFKGDVVFRLICRHKSSHVSLLASCRQYTSDSAGKMSRLPEKVLMGIGNPLLDITISADEAFLQKYDLESNNAIVADKEKHAALFDDMVKNHTPAYGAGGATQNAIRVAQWMLQQPKVTTFLGCVGDDEEAHLLQHAAERDGVYVHYCVTDKDSTGICGAIITGEDRSLIANLGAAKHLSCDWLLQQDNWTLVKTAQFYYIAGFLYQTCPAAVHKIAEHASENNKTLAMNLSAPALCTYFSDPQINMMPYIDVLFGNGVEAEVFCKQLGIPIGNHANMALAVADLPKKNRDRSRIVVFTRGPRSTIVARDGKVTEYPILPIDKSTIKDTNGCGDAFVGGFLSQLVQGCPLEECVRCGNYAAHTILQYWGCNYPVTPDFK